MVVRCALDRCLIIISDFDDGINNARASALRFNDGLVHLFDKFVGFVADLKGLGHQLQKADTCYKNAFNKLHDGNGNLVARADKLRKLAVASKKSLPPELVETATGEPSIIESISAVADDVELRKAEES